MKRMLWVRFLALGLILSWTPVYAGDSNVIPLVKTGLTKSYRTHDDGDLKKGAAWPTPRFTKNNTGTVTDNLTGLIWLKNANCAGAGENWNTAIDYTAALYDGCTNCFGTGGDCGLSDGSKAGDWRVPNRNELLSLIDIAYYNPALSNAAGTGQWSEGNPFISVELVKYWSSSTKANRSALAWTVDFGKGAVWGSTARAATTTCGVFAMANDLSLRLLRQGQQWLCLKFWLNTCYVPQVC